MNNPVKKHMDHIHKPKTLTDRKKADKLHPRKRKYKGNTEEESR